MSAKVHMHTTDNLPSFTNEKFEAALEQSRLLPMPTKALLERIRVTLLERVPYTVAACQREVKALQTLVQEIVDGHMFDAAPAFGPLKEHLEVFQRAYEKYRLCFLKML